MAYEATIRGVGISTGEGGPGPPAVLLEVRDDIIPIFIDPAQAATIEQGRQDIPVERPMTHDLFVDVMDDLHGTLDQVRIDDLADGTFHAKLDLVIDRADGQEAVVCDARPSDGIALAVRVGCPILVAEHVIDEAGQPAEVLGVDATDRSGRDAEAVGIGPNIGSATTEPTGGPASASTDRDEVHIEIHEGADELRVMADLPGVSVDAIDLTCDGRTMALDAASESRQYHEGVELPASVDPATASASYNNGVLEVVLERAAVDADETTIDID